MATVPPVMYVQYIEGVFKSAVVPGHLPIYVKMYKPVDINLYPDVYKDWLTHHNNHDSKYVFETNDTDHPADWSQSLFSKIKVTHPVTGHEGRLNNVIMELNDTYKWSRETIADWLETLDDEQNPIITKKENDNDNAF